MVSWAYAQLSDEQLIYIDSLQQVIATAKNDTVRIRAIGLWDNQIWRYDIDLDYQLNQRIAAIADSNLADTTSLSPEEIAFYVGAAGTGYNIMGIYHQDQGNLLEAIKYYQLSLAAKQRVNEVDGIAQALHNIGNIKYMQGNYAGAVELYTRSLKIREELGNKKGMAQSLNNIGLMNLEQGDIDKALEFYQKSLALKEEIEDHRGIANSLNNIGNVYQDREEFNKALDYYNRLLALDPSKTDAKVIGAAYNNMAACYIGLGDFETALEHCLKGLKVKESVHDQRGIIRSYTSLANTYHALGNDPEAIRYAQKALQMARKMQALLEVKHAALALYDSYKQMGNNHQALAMYELYIESRDSLESEANKKEIIRQELLYTYEKQAAADSTKNAEVEKVKDAQIAEQKAENKQFELKAEQGKQRTFYLYGGLGLALLFGGVIFSRFQVTNRQKSVIETQKKQVDRAYDELEEKNKEILDSIAYAKRIQTAILPPTKVVKSYLTDSFILYKPKDIVAGDFYWLEHQDDIVLFAAADCTGHGVPGAMVSVVCHNALNRSVREHGLTDPGKILNKTREIVVAEFEKSDEEVKDGMDIALCALQGHTLHYAGAHNPLWIIKPERKSHAAELVEIKANKQPIGKFDALLPYTTHTIELEPGDTIYIFSDGYVDQFGGEKGKKFKAKAFRELLLSIQHEPMERQHKLINATFENWKGDFEQVDDVCVMGVKV